MENQLFEKPDQASDRAGVHAFYLGSFVYHTQLEGLVNCDQVNKFAARYIKDLLIRMKPRDALEEMLILQAAWTHARLARLSIMATQDYNPNALKIKNEACDRAANTMRRQMLALTEYRRPPRGDQFVAIKQANLAQTQVVQNVESRDSAKLDGSNEKGLAANPSQALPAHAGGPGLAAGLYPENEAVVADHGGANLGREIVIENERTEARRT